MDDGVYRRSIPLALPLFNWIKTAPLVFDQRGHWLCLCLNYFSAFSLAQRLSDADRTVSGLSLNLQNRFDKWALSHSLAFKNKKQRNDTVRGIN